ncbi:MAG: glycerol-3-phosphate 1-O-acyltransferase PlsY [Puniceicoccales bacterium]|nr:glycerol-3-phosphate 1-O-acyltransferase PlsY [Puniceicoccales bacterium]
MAIFYGGIFLAGYLIGSISFAVLVAKTQGIDILHEGSGSPGATNVKRVLGNVCGNLVFCLDFLKGFLPVFIAKTHFQFHPSSINITCAVLLIGLAIGHSFSIFLKFCGGKSVAVIIGGLTVLMPSALILGLILWYFIFTITRFVSLASLGLALALPLNAYLLAYPNEIICLAFFLMIIIFFRHIPNIHRLLNGVENRFVGRK